MQDNAYMFAEYFKDSFIIVGDSGKILYANPATEVLYGLPIETIQGKTLFEAYPGGLGDRMQRAVQTMENNDGKLIVRNLTKGLSNFSNLIDIRVYSLGETIHKKGAIILSYEVTQKKGSAGFNALFQGRGVIKRDSDRCGI